MVRIKHRYILTEAIIDAHADTQSPQIHEKVVYQCVKNAIQEMHGDYGDALLKRFLNVKYLNPDTKIVLIRVKRGTEKMVLHALTLIKTIGKYSGFFNTLHVSGTIRSSQKVLIQHQKKELIRDLATCTSTQERKKIRQIIDSCEEKLKKKNKYGVRKKMFIPLATNDVTDSDITSDSDNSSPDT